MGSKTGKRVLFFFFESMIATNDERAASNDKREVLHYNKLNFLYNDLMKKTAKQEENHDEKKVHIVDEILAMTSGIMAQVFTMN